VLLKSTADAFKLTKMFLLFIVWWRHYKKNEAFKEAGRREEVDEKNWQRGSTKRCLYTCFKETN